MKNKKAEVLWALKEAKDRGEDFYCAVCQRSCPSLLSQFVLQDAWLKHNMKLGTLCLCPTVFTSPRAMPYVTSLMSGTPSPGTRTLSLSVIRPTSASSFSYVPLPGEIHPCADLRQLQRGSLAEPPTFTCYESNRQKEIQTRDQCRLNSPKKPNGRLGKSVGMSGTRRECTSCNK